MIILHADRGLEQVVKENPTSKVGLMYIYTDIFNKDKTFHPGYKIVSDKLIQAGCDIIVCLIFDWKKFASITKNSIYTPIENIEQPKSVTSCNEDLGIDYLIFIDDYNFTFDSEQIQIIKDNLLIEDYKTQLELTDLEYSTLVDVTQWSMSQPTTRPVTRAAIFYSFHYSAFKHYKEKYENYEVILVNEIFDADGYLYEQRDFILEEPNEDIRSFSKYLSKLDDIKWKEEQDIITKATSLGGTATYRTMNFNNDDMIEIKYTGIRNGSIIFKRIVEGI